MTVQVCIEIKSESECTIIIREPIPTAILQETGFAILQENGDRILKEQE